MHVKFWSQTRSLCCLNSEGKSTEYKILIKGGGRPQRPAGRESDAFAIARSIVQASVYSERSFSGHGQKTSPCLLQRILSPLCTDTRFALWTGPRRVASLAVALLRHSLTDRPAFINKRTSFSGVSTASRTNTTPGELLSNRKCWKVVMPLIGLKRPSTNASKLYQIQDERRAVVVLRGSRVNIDEILHGVDVWPSELLP